jgi:pimeloyl-ACP methyl ester carboxylesterase
MNNAPPNPPAMLPDERTALIAVNGLRLLCREWGTPGAYPLVLLHGLRGFSGTWRTLAANLAPHFRLIALDQRGRGDSDWDPQGNYYTDAYLSDLEGVVDHLHLDRFALLGHSMGGTTAYAYADRHPDRLAALIIEDIAPGSSMQGAGARRIVAEMSTLPESFPCWADARRYWRTHRPQINETALEQRLAESLRQAEGGRIEWRYDARGISKARVAPDSTRIIDLWPVVKRLRVPTLIVHGERSDFCPAATVAEMRRSNGVIESIAIANASHYVHDDAPELFAQYVHEFLIARTTGVLQ